MAEAEAGTGTEAQPQGQALPQALPQPLSGGIRVEIASGDSYILSQCIPEDGRNTAHRAAAAFFGRQAAPCRYDVDIRIHKQIPAAAGLAGGSADAAAVLLALNDIAGMAQMDGALCFRQLPQDELLACALGVGADVPFCLMHGAARVDAGAGDGAGTSAGTGAGGPAVGAALATGIGERLCPLPGFKPLPEIVLANPRAELSTARVFGAFALPCEAKVAELSSLTRAIIDPQRGDFGRCFNVLETASLAICPQIARLKAQMIESGAVCALMSGSGPTVFGMFSDTGAARRAATGIRARGDWAAHCQCIP